MRGVKCDLCYGPATSRCSKCSKVAYCSVKHQKLFWPIHKLNCGLETELNYIVQPPLTPEENRQWYLHLREGTSQKGARGTPLAPFNEERIEVLIKSNSLDDKTSIVRNQQLSLRRKIICPAWEADFETGWIPPLSLLPYYQNASASSTFKESYQLQESNSLHHQILQEAFRVSSIYALNFNDLVNPERTRYGAASKERLVELVSEEVVLSYPENNFSEQDLDSYLRIVDEMHYMGHFLEEFKEGTEVNGGKKVFERMFLDLEGHGLNNLITLAGTNTK